MIERTHPKLSVGAQCQLLSISRSSFYNTPLGEAALNLELMLLIDKQLVIPPFLTGCSRRTHAAIFSFMAGVMPPMAMLGRSLV